MAIYISQAIHRTSANPLDETMALTKAQMKVIDDNVMPLKYLSICQDDGQIYLYDKNATPSEESGKFSKLDCYTRQEVDEKIVEVDGSTILKDSSNVISINEFVGTQAEIETIMSTIPNGATVYTTDN